MPDLLQTALQSPDPRQALAAARTLAGLPDEQFITARAALAEALAAGSPLQQRRAALVCGLLGRRAADLVPALRHLLAGPRWAVRESALHALARVDPDSNATRSAAAACSVLDRSAAVRLAALDLLAQRPGDVPRTIREALNHRHPRIRCRALRAAARLAPVIHAEVFATALMHSHRRVRRTAAELLGALGEAALPAAGRLARARCDGDGAVAWAAREALAALGPHLPAALHPLSGPQDDPVVLLSGLTASLSGETQTALETARLARRARLSERGAGRIDPRAEARWLIGRLVEMLTRAAEPPSLLSPTP